MKRRKFFSTVAGSLAAVATAPLALPAPKEVLTVEKLRKADRIMQEREKGPAVEYKISFGFEAWDPNAMGAILVRPPP